MRVNRQALADIIGVSKPTITAWIDDGLPFVVQGSKGKEWEFDTVEVIEWFATVKRGQRDGRGRPKSPDDPFNEPGEGPETIDSAQRRKESALADKHEIAAAKEARLLVPIEEVAAVVLEENARVRVRILALPNALRPVLLTHLNNDKKATEQCVSQIETTIHEALSEVQSYAEDDEDDDGSDE